MTDRTQDQIPQPDYEAMQCSPLSILGRQLDKACAPLVARCQELQAEVERLKDIHNGHWFREATFHRERAEKAEQLARDLLAALEKIQKDDEGFCCPECGIWLANTADHAEGCGIGAVIARATEQLGGEK